jgi:hypothetical protein
MRQTIQIAALQAMAIRGRMMNPAEMPPPAEPNPRRRSSRPAKLILVVSCAMTIRRLAQAAAVRPARVSTISTVVTDGADKKRWITTSVARLPLSWGLTSYPVSLSRASNVVPTAARRESSIWTKFTGLPRHAQSQRKNCVE